MKTLIVVAMAGVMAGCTVVPASTAHQACDLLQIASDEAQMAPAWYINVGSVLERCGRKDALIEAERKSCYASALNGYRERKECEALP